MNSRTGLLAFLGSIWSSLGAYTHKTHNGWRYPQKSFRRFVIDCVWYPYYTHRNLWRIPCDILPWNWSDNQGCPYTDKYCCGRTQIFSLICWRNSSREYRWTSTKKNLAWYISFTNHLTCCLIIMLSNGNTLRIC